FAGFSGENKSTEHESFFYGRNQAGLKRNGRKLKRYPFKAGAAGPKSLYRGTQWIAGGHIGHRSDG
ncbi:hypothetical protein, partial [Desulfobulbus alkaliphilus]|uniref:hypothetical protein n=1 Tax=Desulfobulbus alkaliphilus TaxID=869814 RepID=UPI00196488A0